MNKERDRLIAEALAAPPPAPEACVLKSICICESAQPVQLRVPAPRHIDHAHIRQAHEVVKDLPRAEYHPALQAEYSRLTDAQPWYWDQLWPGGIALARRLLKQPELVRGLSVLEFGAGIGLLSCAAALAGAARVTATDIEPAALAFAAQSASDNGVADIVRTVAWDWEAPPPDAEVAACAPFDVVLLPDVMYDDAAVERLGVLAPSLVAPGGKLLWADGTDRTYGESHSARLSELLLAAPSPRFELVERSETRAGASAAEGGAAPDRPVLLVVAQRASV